MEMLHEAVSDKLLVIEKQRRIIFLAFCVPLRLFQDKMYRWQFQSCWLLLIASDVTAFKGVPAMKGLHQSSRTQLTNALMIVHDESVTRVLCSSFAKAEILFFSLCECQRLQYFIRRVKMSSKCNMTILIALSILVLVLLNMGELALRSKVSFQSVERGKPNFAVQVPSH